MPATKNMPPAGRRITYQQQYRKCGKRPCQPCQHGRGHGPYWFAFWREGGRVRSAYLGKTAPETKGE